jgi:hypothetical protein
MHPLAKNASVLAYPHRPELICTGPSLLREPGMRPPLLLLMLLTLSACVQASLSKVDYRTYAIDSGGIPGGSDAPNRRLAQQVCPNGYRVLDQTVHRNTPDRARDEPGVFTSWTIRCL